MSAPAPAIVRCAKCGAAFDCDPAGPCWCKDESFRVPMPTSGTATCLCPSCLKIEAEKRR